MSEPYYSDDFVTLYHENCLESLKRFNDDAFQLVITSPPYNMNLRIRRKDGNGEYENGAWGEYPTRKKIESASKYEHFDDNLPIEEYNALHTRILKELLRVSPLVFYNVAIVTGSKRSLFKMIGDFNEQLKDIIIWDKGHGQPAMAENVLNRRTELILVFDKHDAISRQFLNTGTFNRGTLEDLWLLEREGSKHTGHGAVFPEALVLKIIENFSQKGDHVYDPFIGTGTTAEVAKKTGRFATGSDISSDYLDVAVKRLAQEVLFA